MKIFLVSQNHNVGYDTFDSAVVAAETEEEARKIHPWGPRSTEADLCVWATAEHVHAELIGEACSDVPAGHVYCASFNAG